MTLSELEELYERLTNDLLICGDVEYVLVYSLRREVYHYIEAIKNVGQDAVSRKGITGRGEKHSR